MTAPSQSPVPDALGAAGGGGKALPAFITFTGLDAWTDLDRVAEISDRYPVEWGILFSPKRQGVEPRYPALADARRIIWCLRTWPEQPRMAVHLCGGHAREVIETGACAVISSVPKGWFSRIQVNTADPARFPPAIGQFAARHGARGILQCRGLFPNTGEVDWLQDASGGRGVTPERWPSPEEHGPFVGYAGGLGPDTIKAALPAIQSAIPPNTPYWLDMESRIRTDDRLDLDKCEAVCRAVYGAPAQEGPAT